MRTKKMGKRCQAEQCCDLPFPVPITYRPARWITVGDTGDYRRTIDLICESKRLMTSAFPMVVDVITALNDGPLASIVSVSFD